MAVCTDPAAIVAFGFDKVSANSPSSRASPIICSPWGPPFSTY